MRFRIKVEGVPFTWDATLYRVDKTDEDEEFDDYIDSNIYTTKFGALLFSHFWAWRRARAFLRKPKVILDTEFTAEADDD